MQQDNSIVFWSSLNVFFIFLMLGIDQATYLNSPMNTYTCKNWNLAILVYFIKQHLLETGHVLHTRGLAHPIKRMIRVQLASACANLFSFL